MKTQTCSICNKEKNVEEFNFRNKEKNIRHYNCKDCVKISRKKSYNKNAEYYKDKSKRRRKEHANLYDEYKKTLSCKICGESESVCLDFHHIEPNEARDTTDVLVWVRVLIRLQRTSIAGNRGNSAHRCLIWKM